MEINHQDLLMILLAASLVMSLAAMIIAFVAITRYRAIYRKYDFFMRGRDAESLEDLILEEKEDILTLQEEDKNNKEMMRLMNRDIRASIQKVGVVHYDAFEGMGGKMSFALTMLDHTNTGVVLNCMHAREGCFLYVKSVDAGSTTTPLGAEEKESLERALGYIED